MGRGLDDEKRSVDCLFMKYLCVFLLALTSCVSGRIEEVYCSDNSANQSLNPSIVIANGGGGQTGMIEWLVSNFFRYTFFQKDTCFAWFAGNTAQSIEALEDGIADIAVLYDPLKIYNLVQLNRTSESVEHIWLDRFCWIGIIRIYLSI